MLARPGEFPNERAQYGTNTGLAAAAAQGMYAAAGHAVAPQPLAAAPLHPLLQQLQAAHASQRGREGQRGSKSGPSFCPLRPGSNPPPSPFGRAAPRPAPHGALGLLRCARHAHAHAATALSSRSSGVRAALPPRL